MKNPRRLPHPRIRSSKTKRADRLRLLYRDTFALLIELRDEDYRGNPPPHATQAGILLRRWRRGARALTEYMEHLYPELKD